MFSFLSFLSLAYKLYHVLCVVWFLSGVHSSAIHICSLHNSFKLCWIFALAGPLTRHGSVRDQIRKESLSLLYIMGKIPQGTVQNDAVLSYFMQEKKPFRSFRLTENVPQVQCKKERKKDNSDKTWKDKVWSASSHCTLKFDAVSVLTEHAGQNEKVYNASILMTLSFEI